MDNPFRKINDETTKMLIARNVAYYRSMRGMSQYQLGSIIGRTSGWVCKFERTNPEQSRSEKASFSPAIIQTIADALKIPVSWLYKTERKTLDEINSGALETGPAIIGELGVVNIAISPHAYEFEQLVQQLKSLNPGMLVLLKGAIAVLDKEEK